MSVRKTQLKCLAFYWCFVIVISSGEIAQKKCEEYANAVYQDEDSPVLTPNAVNNKVSTCGIVEVPLVVGGTDAGSKEFPHMAVIGYGNSPRNAEWDCGGSLVSEEWILSVAHCAKSRDKGPAKWVRLGELVLGKTNDDTEIQDIAIKEVIVHPDFKTPAKYNDIALIRLENKAEFTEFVRPACLHVDMGIKDKRGIATGFGITDYDKSTRSNHLQKVTLDFISPDECSKYFTNGGAQVPEGIKDTQVCSGVLSGGKDTCQGDSGGPLQVVLEKPYCMYSIVGLTSFGKFCGYKNSPAIYTRVSSYIPWIENIVWK
ncbi:hypothetical protein L9F63_014222 [Diploptera punctata]|uniref:Peptidase S1 domain-containing protein n=1 Tax=Diploptera punctata TaxID=6984 RepID=A0AAD8A941_DIPPU|nr:hypothetical protein L9F63_014222 [Diploptera punctata]